MKFYKTNNVFFCKCGKNYQFKNGLSKHKKKFFRNMIAINVTNLKDTTLLTNLLKNIKVFEKKYPKTTN